METDCEMVVKEAMCETKVRHQPARDRTDVKRIERASEVHGAGKQFRVVGSLNIMP